MSNGQYYPEEYYVKFSKNLITKNAFEQELENDNLEKIDDVFEDPEHKLIVNAPYIISIRRGKYNHEYNHEYIQAYYDSSSVKVKGNSKELILYFNPREDKLDLPINEKIKIWKFIHPDLSASYAAEYNGSILKHYPDFEAVFYKITNKTKSLTDLAVKSFKSNVQTIPLDALLDNETTEPIKKKAELKCQEAKQLYCQALENERGNIQLDWINDIPLVDTLKQYNIKSFNCDELKTKGGKKRKSKRSSKKKTYTKRRRSAKNKKFKLRGLAK
jgi:hypothetical protein